MTQFNYSWNGPRVFFRSNDWAKEWACVCMCIFCGAPFVLFSDKVISRGQPTFSTSIWLRSVPLATRKTFDLSCACEPIFLQTRPANLIKIVTVFSPTCSTLSKIVYWLGSIEFVLVHVNWFLWQSVNKSLENKFSLPCGWSGLLKITLHSK